MNNIKKISTKFNSILVFIASLLIISMVLLIVANSIFREFFIPFRGTSEVVGWFSAMSVTLSVGYAQEHRAHIKLDVINNALPKSIRILNHIVVYVINIIFFSMIFYHLIIYAIYLKNKQTVSDTLAISYYPLILVISIGFLSLVITLITQLGELMKRG